MFKVGRVIHYYDKIGVAIVELDGLLSIGDKIKFVKDGENLFSQDVTEIQVEHEKISSAGKGQVVGLKTKESVKEGSEIYKEG